MILTKISTLEEYALLCERMNDFELFEYVNRLIIPVQSMKAIDDSLMEYMLSEDFDEKEEKSKNLHQILYLLAVFEALSKSPKPKISLTNLQNASK